MIRILGVGVDHGCPIQDTDLCMANYHIPEQFWVSRCWYDRRMGDLAVLLLQLLATPDWPAPAAVRSVVAESVLVKHQLLILNRARKRSPISASPIGCAASTSFAVRQI